MTGVRELANRAAAVWSETDPAARRKAIAGFLILDEHGCILIDSLFIVKPPAS